MRRFESRSRQVREGPFGGVRRNISLLSMPQPTDEASLRDAVSAMKSTPGKTWGNITGVTGKVISGWGINGVTTFQSGNPLPISAASNMIGFVRSR